ncbi:crotonase/enoyl-CoA hydratase family protein [Bradyrhizobium sp. AUGA SZCCT0240]|uniref:crotonase/enoyl-CoA hydratase family protein n=1 Tax=Bradyrhizobium sp. AUGA SZCCT0240 TaxID=2807669 RepID=UPI001BACE872|nr:crotonase/enoyl-CoA hydratase family protein [Bradyrhizobium sp. AUGA SZCCT0240]MBR1252325.1 crotonase/enoyl-CoA hydratase family protein [Bradyrhizobium sp. AUGA SZCCT0240]
MTQSSEEGSIDIEVRGRILLIEIDRPKKLNAFSAKMLSELGEAYVRLEEDASIFCGVLYAKGPNFTAGIDLAKFVDRMAAGKRALPFPEGKIDPCSLRPPFRTTPLVVSVQGICFTIGIELMLAADIVVAADECRFAQLEVKRGIMTAGGPTFRMVERAGWGNAMRYLLTGDEFDAATAYRLGFVQEVVPTGTQFQRALHLAERIAAQAPLAVSATIENARIAIEQGPAAAVAQIIPTQKRLLASEDAKEGVQSFVERRTAKFVGR